MRNFALAPLLLVALSACSVPKAEGLDCGEDQSIFACQAKFSDGKSRSIVFVNKPMPNATVLDEVTTRDDLGNMYCVTLYSNVTATYAPGLCGASTAATMQPSEPTATTVDPNAVPQGLACVDGSSVFDCRAVFSDGTTRELKIVDSPPEGLLKADSDPHRDEAGNVYCVTLYATQPEEQAIATFRAGGENC